ncbi:uncharacterized protein TNCV_3263841 [Trichonephila clavipes]|nr:uncharacterized protein TNCV_3263841 [Trichonephila clavipes]
MSLNKLKKDELKIVAEELNLTVPEGAKIAYLKSLISQRKDILSRSVSSPKTREIPKNIPYHDVFMGTLPSSRRGKRVTLFGGGKAAPITPPLSQINKTKMNNKKKIQERRPPINSDVYKKDKELVQSAIDYALAEIKNKRLDSETKLEFERIKLAQLQKQLELENIQKNLPQNYDIRNQSVCETAANINVETLLKYVKTLTIPVPSRVESYNLFFQSLEKAFKIKEVPEQFKGEILLNILGERANTLLVHVPEEELNNYNSINETKVHCGLIRDDLNKTLEKFWKVEEVEEPIVKNKERLICEEHYASTHFRTKEGKYVVSMPLKKEPSCLGNSKDIALKRLGSLWNRLARDENYLNLYREFLRDYERLGHMKEVTNETEPKITY